MKRIIKILCCLLMLANPVAVRAFAADAEEIPANLEEELESCYGYQSLKLLGNHSILTTYIDLYERVGRFNGSFSSEELVFQKPLTKEQFTTAWYAFRGDTPQYFWYSPYFPTLIKSTDETDKYQSCIIRYSYASKEDLDKAKMQFDAAVNVFMSNSGIDTDMSELLKELILYKKVGEYIHVEDVEDMEQLTYRAIVEKRGSCLGVSNAFAYILKKNGIMAYVVNGKVYNNANHAWVLVKIDGKYTWCDLTWDAYGGEVRTQYLNLSKQVFQKDHIFIEGYILPDGSTALVDLFEERNGVISKKDVDIAIKKFLDTGEKIDGTWYLPIYADGDFSSAYDFWAWWDANEQENCWSILHGISPSVNKAWEIAKLGNVWIIAAAER